MRDPQGAFDGLCRDVSPRLVGALVLQFGDRGRDEDIAQEALARAWARWREVSRMDHPERWVFTVAYRLAIGSVRRRGSEDRAYARHGAGGSAGTRQTPTSPRHVLGHESWSVDQLPFGTIAGGAILDRSEAGAWLDAPDGTIDTCTPLRDDAPGRERAPCAFSF